MYPGDIIDEPSLRNRTQVFEDRLEAGRRLAHMLEKKPHKDAIVLAIPSGGVPVGLAISQQLRVPLDVVVVRKVPIPDNPEAGFGAIALDSTLVLNEPLVYQLGLDHETIQTIASARLKEIRERLEKFRGKRKPADLNHRDLIIVDDGLASGFTMLVAVRSLKKHNPASIVVAVPTAHIEALRRISPEVDKVYCLNVRSGSLFAVADAYAHWYDVSDEEVKEYLRKAWLGPP